MCRDEICDIPLPSAAGISAVIPGSLRELGITERYTSLSGWYIKFHPDTEWGYLYYKLSVSEVEEKWESYKLPT